MDVWGLSEVNDADDARLFEAGAEQGENANFTRVLGSTGGGDRLLLLYDEGRFDLVRKGELDAINVRGNVRAPLYAQLRDARTGAEFIFMVNHLYRSDDAARHWQAAALNDWAEAQTLPLIAVGDYNFDWSVEGGERDHDAGYDNLTADGVWKWVRPAALVSTQDSRYDDVLDLLTSNATSVSVLISNGDATFLPPVSTEIQGVGDTISMAVGDFNDDGLLDVAVGTYSYYWGGPTGTQVEVLLGNGDGGFTQGDLHSVPRSSYHVPLAVADVNSDGRPDVLVGSNDSMLVSVPPVSRRPSPIQIAL